MSGVSSLEHHWNALARGALVVPRCADCGVLVWYPRPRCPKCMSTRLDWETLSGRGTIYSFTINRRGRIAPEGELQPLIAIVELDEGPRVFAHVRGIGAEEASIGLEVAMQIGSNTSTPPLLMFQPAS